MLMKTGSKAFKQKCQVLFHILLRPQTKITKPLYFFRNLSYNIFIGQIKADKTPTDTARRFLFCKIRSIIL